jgi:hypothetical protein
VIERFGPGGDGVRPNLDVDAQSLGDRAEGVNGVVDDREGLVTRTA